MLLPTITVADASQFPTTNGFTVTIDNEQMTVVAGAGTNTWTVLRGANGTNIVSHQSNASVVLPPVTAFGVATLDGSTDASSTSLQVFNFSSFPTTPGFVVQIDGEQMLVTGVATNPDGSIVINPDGSTTWTVSRGFNGTIATGHGPNSFGVPASVLLESGFSLAIDGENMQVQTNGVSLITDPTTGAILQVQYNVDRPNPATHYINATVQEIISNGTDLLGRIRAVLNQVVGLLNGSASGVMYSQFNALSPGGAPVILNSDSVANNTAARGPTSNTSWPSTAGRTGTGPTTRPCTPTLSAANSNLTSPIRRRARPTW